MSLDVNALRARLNELSNRSRLSDIIWKPTEGTNVVRIVPLASNPNNPFIEAYFHYMGGKTYLSPKTFGEPDPIEEFANSLRSETRLPKEEWIALNQEARKFQPKARTYVPVIVRGEEAKGVRLWGFGKTTYAELLAFTTDEEYGDITDVESGRDIRVDFTPGEKTPNKFPKTSIRISPKQTPLTTDIELRNKFLTVQPNLFDAYKKVSYDELKEVLAKFLSPGGKAAESAASEEWDEPTETPSPTAEKSEKAASKPVKDVDEEFEKMFNN